MFGFCLAMSLSVNAAQAQGVTLKTENQTMKAFLEQIERVSPYRFSYLDTDLPARADVTVSASDEPVEPLLTRVLSPRGLMFSRNGNNFAIKPIPQTSRQPLKLTGTVTDEAGNPIMGATITVKGGSAGAITGEDGAYSLNVPPDGVVVVSFLGYEVAEKSVSNRTVINIALKQSTTAIDDIVVVGYGTMSSRLVSSSIAKVKMDDIDAGNDYNPLKMLQGRVSGVNISNSSGTPGSAPNVLVRGVGSISGGSSPLYVVDGIPSEKYPNINPSDIESVEVLKDASASAIYGSRANAGVVLMTTKSGKSGRTEIDLSGHYGVGTIANDIEMANTQEYLQVMRAAIDNYNVQTGSALSLYVPENPANTSWVKNISRKFAQTGTASLSVSGGNDKTTFFTSFGANYQEGYLKRTSFQQYNFRAKVGHRINRIFKLNLNMSLAASLYDMQEEESTSLKVLRTAREEQPWASPYRENGEYSVMSTELVRHNPVMLTNEETWTLGKYQGAGTISVDITPFKGFKYTPSVSVYGIFDNEKKALTDKHDARAKSAGWAALRQQKDVSVRYVIDNIFSYENSYDRLTYSALLGHSFERYGYERFGAYSDNYANEAFPSPSFGLINAGPNIYAGSISYASYALESYFGRISMNWDDRYVLNASLRSDGSSRFSKSHRYGYFPSASVAWLVSNEKFFPRNTYVTDVKLRLSYGVTGSMAGIGNYAPLSLISAGGGSYNGQSGFRISQDGVNLKWEKARQFNLGLDFSLFRSRIDVTLDMFHQKTTDLLFKKPVVSTTGYSTIQSNIGALQNRGIELSITGRPFTGAFKWTLSGNISIVDNKLLSLIDGQDMFVIPSSGSNLIGGTMHALINGKPIGAWYMYRMEGIYQTDADVPEKLYKKGVRAGDVRYFDKDGDGDITEEDRLYVGKATPDFYGGISSSMSYKGFDLNIFCQFSGGGKILASWRGVNGVEGTEHLGLAFGNTKPDGVNTHEQFFNVSKDAATNYWRGPGTSNTMPRPVRGGVHTGYSGADYNTLTSTRYLENASYFRIKTITLGYTLPEAATRKIGMKSVRVYVSADNLFTFTQYSGYDPEASFNSNPGETNYGVDFGLQPTLRTFLAGLSLKF